MSNITKSRLFRQKWNAGVHQMAKKIKYKQRKNLIYKLLREFVFMGKSIFLCVASRLNLSTLWNSVLYFFWRWIKKSWKNGWRQKKILLCLKCKSIISSRLSFFSLICEKYLHYDLTMKSHSMCKFVEVRWCYCNYLKVKLYLD